MPAILFAVAVATAVWLLVFVLRGSLLAGCLAYLLVACCFGDSFFKLDVRPVPLTLDRVIIIPLAAAFCVQRFLGRTSEKSIGGADIFLFALLAWIGVSTFTHGFQATFPGQVPPIWRLVAGYLVPAGIYWLARQSPLDQRRVVFVHGSLIAFGVYLAVTGICEVTGQWWAVFPRHIADPALGLHFGRARGPMLTSVSYGMYVAVALLGCLAFRPAWRRDGRFLAVLLVPLFLSAIFFSYTRSVWVGAVAGLLPALWLTLQGRARHVVTVGLLVTVLAGGGLLADRIMRFQRDSSASDTHHSAVMRIMLAHVSFQMFQDYPVAGVGFGHFSTQKMPYLSDRTTQLPLESIRPLVHHNTFLSVLTETGAVGLFLFVGLLVSWARTSWQLWSSPATPAWARSHAALMLACLGLYSSQLMFHELSYSALDNALIFFLAGITVGLRQPLSMHTAAELPATLTAHASSHARPFGLAVQRM
jgi:O-antigen ligase